MKVRSTVLDCHPTEKNFIMLQFQNFISPNGDGKNDVLDFSDLRSKENPSMKIFNRYGKLIFEGTSSNNFIWDGKQNGYRQETGSYWYKLEWTEPGSTQVQKISNSIILKNK
ncbi:T9SS type B sorting domain-containing protein [uncultured Weeksella sp.]|uniref:T9SS type B sorting domain-containing protein n=1 Tax=uncultured Weeksella sp. TaxID=1161389 RepID=UPI00259BEF8C|nr:T9SS type B sorting domain-containing protein [uncultured Weeksella sp.]